MHVLRIVRVIGVLHVLRLMLVLPLMLVFRVIRTHIFFAKIEVHLKCPFSDREVEELGNDAFRQFPFLHLIFQPFFLAPDMGENDGIFSQYLLLTNEGYHSYGCQLTNAGSSVPSRFWPLPSFHVVQHDGYQIDTIPPSRITDLKIQIKSLNFRAKTLIFTWTAPGDDFNFGRAMYYTIYCGNDRNDLSYHNCRSLDVTLVSAHESGTQEKYEFEFSNFDTEVFFAVRASDSARNLGEESNIVAVYVPTSTTTVPTTSTSTYIECIYFERHQTYKLKNPEIKLIFLISHNNINNGNYINIITDK